MNVGELKKFLMKFPDDMELVNGRMSDYEIVKESDFSVIFGVDKNGWVMRSHPTMSEENKSNQKQYLYLVGN